MKRRSIIWIVVIAAVVILAIAGTILYQQKGYLLSVDGRITHDMKTWKSITNAEPHLFTYNIPSSWSDDIGSSTEGMNNRSGTGKVDPVWFPSWKRSRLVPTDSRSVEAAPVKFDISIRDKQTAAPPTPYSMGGNWDTTKFQTNQGLAGEFKVRSPLGMKDVRLFKAVITNPSGLIVEFIGLLPQYSGKVQDDAAVISVLHILKSVRF